MEHRPVESSSCCSCQPALILTQCSEGQPQVAICHCREIERERKEMVIRAVHPRYTLPEQPNKMQTRKLLPEAVRADARQFDQSMFFSDKGNTARPAQPRNPTGKLTKAQARARKRTRSFSHQGNPADPAVPDAPKLGPHTPGTNNKRSKGGKVGDRAWSLKKH